jgi:uncharacterized protein YecE (DUF72 family)
MGAPAFRHRDWLGTLYPKSAPEAEWLALYASKLDALELNSTFYGLPSEATLDRWIAETPDQFRFCPKVPRAISHELGSSELQASIYAFTTRLERLGRRLGPSFIQLSERVQPEHLSQLCAALDSFPEGFALAVEVRHAGWFASGVLRDDLLTELERRGVTAVITDVAGRRDVSHASLPTEHAFVRFVGEGGHETDAPRVAAWVARLLEWRTSGLGDAYFFVHQPDDVAAPQLLAIASTHAIAAGIPVPPVLLEPPPVEQLALF